MNAMGTGFFASCWVLAAVPAAWAEPAGDQGAAPPPFELVRALRALQDKTAYGDKAAYLAQRELLARLAGNFARTDRKLWKQEKNARAALVYALSGGNQRVLRSLLGSGAAFGTDEALLKGALAYGAGRYARAAKHLRGIDPRQLDASLAGHIALVQSALVAKEDPAKAARLLDFARLSAPGTLIEESALRRQISLLAAAGDFSRMERLASQYLRRFSRSIYADNFVRKFIAFLSSAKYPATATRRRGLAAILAHLDSDRRRASYLSIAGQSVIAGRLHMSRFAARKALALAPRGSTGEARAVLYEAASLVVTDEMDKGLAALSKIDRSKLNAPDLELHDAVLALADEVRRVVERPAEAAPVKPAPVVQRARDMIAQVDKLIGGAIK